MTPWSKKCNVDYRLKTDYTFDRVVLAEFVETRGMMRYGLEYSAGRTQRTHDSAFLTTGPIWNRLTACASVANQPSALLQEANPQTPPSPCTD